MQVQQKVRRDIVLVVGQLTEQVTVNWRTPLLISEESSLGQVISNRSISELPLNGRNYLQLGILAPGMTPAIKGRNNGQDSAFLANGLRYTMNNYLLDGVDNNSQITNLQSGGTEITRPSIDAIQEFKIQTSNFSAEFGRSAGAVINVTVKSGTNDFHGTAYEFHRNSALDAKNFFDRPDRPIPPFIHNQFGGSFGGPIAKDRTFFFVSWEGTRIRKGLTEISNVPTLAQRQGDFGSRPMFDPDTVRQNPAGSGHVRDRFPNNIIPRNRWDPVSAHLIELYPVVRQYFHRCANHIANTSRTERNVGLATTLRTRLFFELLRPRTAIGQARAGKLISHCRRSRRHCHRARKKTGTDAARRAATVGAGGSRPLLLRASVPF